MYNYRIEIEYDGGRYDGWQRLGKDGALQYSQEEIAEGFDFLKNLEDNHVIPTLQKVAGDGADLIDTNANWIDGHYAGIFLYDTSIVKHAEAVKDGEFVIGDYI